MIFGFNTDVKVGDTVYHVQSEARKADQLLQTQVFVRGRCIGKKATSYAEQVGNAGFNDDRMHEMLKSQHKSILEAVRESRVEGMLEKSDSVRIGAPAVIRKVDRLSCVRYASARYSVPTRLIGTSVAVVLDHGAVCLVEPATGVVVAEHELGAPGTASILDDHYDGPRPAPNRGPRPKTRSEQQFCALGADAEAFLVGAAAIGNTRLGSELEILLALGAAHGTDALIAALRRAVAFRRFHAADDGASS